MESIFKLSTESCEHTIKFYKKTLGIQSAGLVFMFLVLFFNCHTFANTGSKWGGLALGGMITNILWFGSYAAMTWGDLRAEKQKLKHLIKFNDEQQLCEERKQYLMVKKHYERLIAIHKEQP